MKSENRSISEVEKLLDLDCENPECRKKVEMFILNMKPVKKMIKKNKISVLDVKTLEMIKNGLCIRYGYRSQWISEHYKTKREKYEDGSISEFPMCFWFYDSSIITHDKKWTGNVYGKSLWELLAKMIIKIYINVKSGEYDK